MSQLVLGGGLDCLDVEGWVGSIMLQHGCNEITAAGDRILKYKKHNVSTNHHITFYIYGIFLKGNTT